MKKTFPAISKRYTDEEVYNLFKKYCGNISAITNALDCTLAQFEYWLNRNPERKIQLQKSREYLVDYAETTLVNLLQSQDPKVQLETAKFILQNQGRSKGWYGNAPAIQTVVFNDSEKKAQIQQIFGL